ncbi:Ribosomal RNA methyltransferase [Fasciola gigantica]|uniref:GPN-loop GTPase 3 n=1 Tax=Fasciola gigantica TaxID=46835 RepID=A0A504YV08_FASGI|nr:Ribosomal RNA methyltransferase [Fasciola gigantica]
MPRFAQLVVGPAGCGKSTYCATIQAHCEAIRRTVDVVNLDPAAEYFEYNPLADIRDLIHVDDVMQDESIHLGPNGGLIFCMEYLNQNLDWLDSVLGDCEGDYLLFDCPGQIELYSHLPIMPKIVEHLQRKWDFRLVSVFILDARFLVDSSHFMAGVLSALSAMVSLATAHVNIMSKMDLLSEKKQKLVIARYLNPDMNYFFEQDLAEHSSRADCKEKHSRLTVALANLVERYSVVHFMPLNRENEETVADILRQIDDCLQYDEEVDPPNRTFDEAERELAVLAGDDDNNDDEKLRLTG